MENLFEKIDRLNLGKTSIGNVIDEVDQLRARNAELEAKHYDSAKQFYELSTEYSQLEAKLSALEKRLQAHQTRGNTPTKREDDHG